MMEQHRLKEFKTSEFRKEWVSDGIDDACIEYLERFGFYLCDKKDVNDRFPGYNAMTTSQLRNIFSEAKQIEVQVRKIVPDFDKHHEEWNRDIRTKILLLRPKIAYSTARAADRNNKSRMKDFREVIEKALEEATKHPTNYLNFIHILEAIIAYHKVYGGRDK